MSILGTFFVFKKIRFLRHIRGAERFFDVTSRLIDRFHGDPHRIGPHVCNEADLTFFPNLHPFIELLCQHHCPFWRKAKHPGSLRLKPACNECRLRGEVFFLYFNAVNLKCRALRGLFYFFSFFSGGHFNLVVPLPFEGCNEFLT